MLAHVEHLRRLTDMLYSPSVYFSPSTVLTITQRARGAAWRMGLAHAREDHLLIWVTRGTAQAIAGGRRFQFSSHTALFIPAQTLFSFTFEQTCFGQTVALPHDAPLMLPETPQMLRVREPKAQLELTGHIEAMQSESSQSLPFADAAVTAHAQLMSVWWGRYRNEIRQHNGAKRTAAQRLMDAFCALVVQSERTKLSGAPMATFAAKLGVTPTHLTRVCKAQCGLTAADLVTQHVLQRALRGLKDTQASAADISRSLGFSSPAYFTRFIASHTGRTPIQFRQDG